jgi:glycine/serine hydroxymethyltransferase
MSDFLKKVEHLVNRAEANNHWRQHQCINLIPSETTPSLLVKFCEISDPSGRYAEHRTMKGREVYFYQGIDFIRDVEEEARDEMRTFFGCSEAEMRPISGQMANEIVFKAMTKHVNKRDGTSFKRLHTVMNNDLGKGGHLSSQPMGALFNYVDPNPETGAENCVNFPIMKDNPYRIDVPKLLEMVEQVKPEMVVFGKSMFIYPEPVREFYNVVKDWKNRPMIMFDMAHVLGLYGAFQEPLSEGADVITGSTHKTFFGPQRGVIVSNMAKKTYFRKVWLEIKSRAFPGSTSNHHLGTLLALLMATYEMNAYKDAYQKQVQKNARAFAKYLGQAGVPVEGDASDGYTQTHQVLLRVIQYGPGEEIARRLEENNIVCNYQALPDDETFLKSSGLRMGVQEMTRYGMVESDFEAVAEFIADVVIRNKTVKDEVAAYRKQFLTQSFCVPYDQAASFGARLLSTVFPSSDFAKLFADQLQTFGQKLSL